MREVSKRERQIVYNILDNLGLENNYRHELTYLMQALGFETDVSFSRSLFSDQLAFIYKRNDGDYEKFISSDSMFGVNCQTRQLLFKIFRIYHEHKIKNQGTQSLNLPDSGNLQEIISFQKKMYELLEPLMPKNSKSISQPSTIFSPFPLQNDFGLFQSTFGSAFLNGNSSFNQNMPENNSYGMYPITKTDPFMQRHSLYLKRKSGQFGNIIPPTPTPFLDLQKKTKGFTAFGQEDDFGQPVKKIKIDSNFPCQESKSDEKIKDLKQSGLIKQSVSEYISDKKQENSEE